MKIFDLKEVLVDDFIQRPTGASEVTSSVREICIDIQKNGDSALKEISKKLDGYKGDSFLIKKDVLRESLEQIESETKEAFKSAKENIENFHKLQKPKSFSIINKEGVETGVRWTPFQRVGLYIPGGTAPLVSTVLMLAIPAKIAGVKEIVAISPSSSIDSMNKNLLAAFAFCGIEEVYCIGGAQGIAALGYGTESIPSVEKIFGPGNQFVDSAKRIIKNSPNAADIDMEAGPSEVLIIADKNANSTFVAADLLAQLEHGTDSSALLITNSSTLAKETQEELKRLYKQLERKDIIEKSLENCKIGIVSDLEEAILISEKYAPEHLILSVENPDLILERINNAGSIFLGNYTPETLGDYLSGTNHVLPTNGQARFRSGVSTLDFLKKITWQKASRESLAASLKVLETLTNLEGLDAHKLAAQVRFL